MNNAKVPLNSGARAIFRHFDAIRAKAQALLEVEDLPCSHGMMHGRCPLCRDPVADAEDALRTALAAYDADKGE